MGHCATCGEALEPGVRYCTGCGVALERDQSADVTALVAGAPASTDSGDSRDGLAGVAARGRKRAIMRFAGERLWLVPMLGALLVLVAVVAGCLGFLWVSAADERDTRGQQLSAAAARNADLARRNTQLETKLGDATELASQRAMLLARADKVLGAVEPLLSSVDELQRIALELQSGRSNYQSASEELKSDLISLANYLLDVDPDYADWGWVNSMIDEINSEIGTLNYYGGEMADTDTKYDSATRKFDVRATSLNQSIRALQQKLKAAGK